MISVLSAYADRLVVFRSEADAGAIYVARNKLLEHLYITVVSSRILVSTLGWNRATFSESTKNGTHLAETQMSLQLANST